MAAAGEAKQIIVTPSDRATVLKRLENGLLCRSIAAVKDNNNIINTREHLQYRDTSADNHGCP